MDVRARLGSTDLGGQLAGLGLDEQDRSVVLRWATELDEADLARIGQLAAALVERCPRRLAGVDPNPFTPADAAHRLGAGVLPLFALVVAAPRLARAAADQGYPDEVVRATQADLGQQLRTYRRVHGVTGLDTQWWLALVFSAGFARLGRLQYEVTRSDLGRGRDDWVLAVHVPGDGPLEAGLVDDSLARATTFFEQHHPDLAPIDWFTCTSWLLDPALRFLVPGSNIAAFGARWDVWRAVPNDRDGLYFGFDVEAPGPAQVPGGLGALPTDTGLHRALVEHWRSGEQVMVCAGRIPIIRQVEDEDPTVVS